MKSRIALAAALLALAPVARGATFDLKTGTVAVSLPGGTSVTMWGFGCNVVTPACPTSAISVPGPALVVPPGDTSLTINLTNALPEPVSIVVPGQPTSSAPTFFMDAGVPDIGVAPRRRVRSLAPEAGANGGTQTYSWTGVRAGTFLYQSGSHPGVQVLMGLYGRLAVQPAAGQAYAGVPYDKSVTLVLGEIDPQLVSAVSSGRYGQTPPNPVPPGLTVADYPTSPVDYRPTFFTVNGKPYDGTAITADDAGLPLLANDTILLRWLNAGLRSHAMELLGPTPDPASGGVGFPAPYQALLAEDGNPSPYRRYQTSAFLPAGKTIDVLVSPGGAGPYTLLDRTLALTNDTALGDAGLRAVLSVGASGGPTANADAYSLAGNTVFAVPAAAGVLANDTGAGTLTASLVSTTTHGALTLAADGSFAYTPNAGFAGGDGFTYKAYNGTSYSNGAQVTLTVSLPPVAAGDAYAAVSGTPKAVAAPGVLANDSSPAGKPLTAVNATAATCGSVALAADGSFTFTPPAGAATCTFTYQASDGSLTSAAATVTMTVTAAPQPPVGVSDSYATTATATAPSLSAAAPGVLGNDTNPSGATLTAAIVTNPTKLAGGSFTLNPDGSFSYWTKNLTATTDTFTYRASSGGTPAASPTTVTIAIAAHPAPVANADTFSAPIRRRNVPYSAALLSVLSNDTATNAAINPTTVTISSQPNRGGSVSVNATTGVVSYTPAVNFAGTDVFSYRVRDTLGAISSSGTVKVNVK